MSSPIGSLCTLEGIDLTDYPKQTMSRQQAAILNFYGFRAFKPYGVEIATVGKRPTWLPLSSQQTALHPARHFDTRTTTLRAVTK